MRSPSYLFSGEILVYRCSLPLLFLLFALSVGGPPASRFPSSLPLGGWMFETFSKCSFGRWRDGGEENRAHFKGRIYLSFFFLFRKQKRLFSHHFPCNRRRLRNLFFLDSAGKVQGSLELRHSNGEISRFFFKSRPVSQAEIERERKLPPFPPSLLPKLSLKPHLPFPHFGFPPVTKLSKEEERNCLCVLLLLSPRMTDRGFTFCSNAFFLSSTDASLYFISPIIFFLKSSFIFPFFFARAEIFISRRDYWFDRKKGTGFETRRNEEKELRNSKRETSIHSSPLFF